MSNNLLIGIIESEQQIEDQLSDSYESFRTNKIGGYPVLSPESTADTISRFNALVCDCCGRRVSLVLQMYCPIDCWDRNIYLFVCINTDCNQNNWFVFRSVTPIIDINVKNKAKVDEKSVWIEGQMEWGIEGDNSGEPELTTDTCAHSMAELTVNESESRVECEPNIIEPLAYFRPLYVTVIDEPIGSKRDDKHIKQLMESYESNNEKQNFDKIANNSNETYEQNYLNSIYGNDRKNYEFFKRLSIFPKQIIRYEWSGTPLLNSDNHKPIARKCDSCGADRCFEFQLMPALINYLKPFSDSHICPDIDFGTVLIYTCSKNCVKSGPFGAEQCIVLSDPDNQFVDKIKKIIGK